MGPDSLPRQKVEQKRFREGYKGALQSSIATKVLCSPQ